MFGLKGADGKHNSSYSVTQLNGFQTNLFGMSNNEIDIHMSNLDEETKRILAEVEPDAQSGSNDSKDKSKKKEYTEDDDKTTGLEEWDDET